jgi:hypothetical protein
MNLMRSIFKGILVEDNFFFSEIKFNSALEKQVMEDLPYHFQKQKQWKFSYHLGHKKILKTKIDMKGKIAL